MLKKILLIFVLGSALMAGVPKLEFTHEKDPKVPEIVVPSNSLKNGLYYFAMTYIVGSVLCSKFDISPARFCGVKNVSFKFNLDAAIKRQLKQLELPASKYYKNEDRILLFHQYINEFPYYDNLHKLCSLTTDAQLYLALIYNNKFSFKKHISSKEIVFDVNESVIKAKFNLEDIVGKVYDTFNIVTDCNDKYSGVRNKFVETILTANSETENQNVKDNLKKVRRSQRGCLQAINLFLCKLRLLQQDPSALLNLIPVAKLLIFDFVSFGIVQQQGFSKDLNLSLKEINTSLFKQIPDFYEWMDYSPNQIISRFYKLDLMSSLKAGMVLDEDFVKIFASEEFADEKLALVSYFQQLILNSFEKFEQGDILDQINQANAAKCKKIANDLRKVLEGFDRCLSYNNDVYRKQ